MIILFQAFNLDGDTYIGFVDKPVKAIELNPKQI